jgi:Flp pilus assembly protein TadG
MLGQLWRRLGARGEHGAVLPIVALAMVALCGLTALSIDVGRVTTNRRQLQNAADAAAFAGASRLPTDPSGARATATDWATRNGIVAGDTLTTDVFQTTRTNDTIEVTIQRDVPYTFARVLGLFSAGISATARVNLYVTQGIDTQRNGAFPYAVWAGNQKNPDGSTVKPGDTTIFRSNQYAKRNVDKKYDCTVKNPSPNCNWDVTSNTFKGFFHWKNRYVYIDPNSQEFSQGGNAMSSEPVDELVRFQQAGIPIWLPVITKADDKSQSLHFTVVNFVCVLLDPIDTQGSADWSGVIQDPRKNADCAKGIGLPTGGQNPGANLEPVYTYRLTR